MKKAPDHADQGLFVFEKACLSWFVYHHGKLIWYFQVGVQKFELPPSSFDYSSL